MPFKSSRQTGLAGSAQRTLLQHDVSVQLRLDFEQLPVSRESSATLQPDEAVVRLAARFAALLAETPTGVIRPADVDALAREFFGAAAGHARDAYDALEAGFNRYLERLSIDFTNPERALATLAAGAERLPLQSRRDRQQVELQQFSTPPALAYLVTYAAALWPGIMVLEPSAGTGSLATLAYLHGAVVCTNEIAPRRLALLRWLGFKPTAHDAERLDNLLAPECQFDVIVMNPPFSATGGRVQGHSNSFGARHVEQALLRLAPGGRLVAIVGAGMAIAAGRFQGWWNALAERYHLRANLGLAGEGYRRFGTTFDHQLVVIDHTGPTSSAAEIITGVGLSYEQALGQLSSLAQEDVYGRLSANDVSTSRRDPGGAVRPAAHAAGEPASRTRDLPAGGRRRGLSRASGQLALDGRMAPLEPPGLEPAAAAPGDDDRSSAGGAVPAARGADEALALGDLAALEHARPTTEGVGELEPLPPAQHAELEEGAVFAAYRIQKAVVRGSQPHPANVVESAAMACVEPPDVTYRHCLPAEIIVEGRISNLQLEDLIYAGQATSQFLPSGARKGHWNGDGTGIGKGRELYAFLYNEYCQGRTKHVHISASHQLCADAERDRSALGLPLKILHQAKLKPAEPILAEAGVVFTTYTMLATDFQGDRPRFRQLVDWLGTDFEGVIAFDEAHFMKNAATTPHGGQATVDQGTLRGNMGIALQRLFPQARVRYFSATGATEARHMAPYERLGLWGPGAPFADFPAFLVAMERGGVAAMEMLCRDLKGTGSYLSRTISYGPTRAKDGTLVPQSAVEYEPILHQLSRDERQQYDRIADLWSELLVAFEQAERRSGEPRRGSRYSQFYAAQQRFFLQLMMSYAIQDLVPAIRRDLEQGRSVVVSLFNTGEAQTDRKVQAARAEGLDLAEVDSTPREMIVELIDKQFPLFQYEERTDPLTGHVVRARILNAFGNPQVNRENQRRQDELFDQVADLDYPRNPLDVLLDVFGASMVAEISGRTHRFEANRYVRRKLAGVPHRELNEHETRLFQAGAKRVAVLTGAGSTGISVHADLAAKNQERRVFYALQLSWSADQQMQAFGRVHRSNQSSAPVIRLALVDVASQKRLVNAVSKRLAALGALTKGERHSLSSELFRPEDVTDEFGKAALARLYRELQTGRFADLDLGLATLARMGVLNKEGTAVRENYAANVEQFLNRIMALHVETQNRLFDLFYERYLEAVEAAKRQGAFDFGVEEIRARNLRPVATPEILFVDPDSGARTTLHELSGEVDVLRHGFDSVASSASLGFFRNLRSQRIYGVCEHGDPDRKEMSLVAVKGPRRGLDAAELEQKYERVKKAEARVWWDAEYERTPATEERRFHLLSGAVFPIYDKIMGAAGIRSVKIARAVLDDGQALVGLNLSPEDVPSVKQRLGIGTPLAAAQPAEILGLLAAGSLLELDNGWRLGKATIAGDEVFELLLDGLPASREELLGYGFAEEILRFKRRWFVAVEVAVPTLEGLVARRKPVRQVTS